jgi:hypothetical protein
MVVKLIAENSAAQLRLNYYSKNERYGVCKSDKTPKDLKQFCFWFL